MLQNIGQHLDALQKLLTTPLGMAVLVLGAAMMIVAYASEKARWSIISIVLWVSTLGVNTDEWIDHTLATPLEQIRSLSRPLFIVGLLGVICSFPAANRRHGGRWLHPGSLLLFLLHIVLFARLATAGFADRGFLGLMVHTLTFVAAAVVCAKWINSLHAARMMLGAVVGAGVFFVFGVLYQLVMNSSAVVWDNRLFGTTGNPQHAAQFLSLFCLPTLYFATSTCTPKWMRFFLYGLLALQVPLILWTGSRTGMLMLLVGVVMYYRFRIGRLAFSAALVSVIVVVTLPIFLQWDATAGWSRILSTQNTRSAAWITEYQEFLEAPLFGKPRVSTEGGHPIFRENSYLAAAKAMGVVGGALLIAAVSVFVISATRLMLRARMAHPEIARLADLLFASIVMLSIGAVFEAYLLATIAPAYVVLYLYAGAVQWLSSSSEPSTETHLAEHAAVHPQTRAGFARG